MCTYSMIADHYRDKWQNQPWFPNVPAMPMPGTLPNITQITLPSPISREEFDALKREVADMKELLKRAKEYDAKNGEPDCEMAEKVAILRRVAEMVGVDLGDVVEQKPA